MMFRIQKDFHFSAAHYLHYLPDEHPCARLHGHNYIVRVILENASVDSVGFVRDYRDLDLLSKWLDNLFDHRELNHVLHQPSAEYLARFVYEYAATLYPEVVSVGVSETPKTWAWYTPNSLPPLDAVLEIFRTLAEEPLDNTARQELATNMQSLLQRVLADG